MTKMTMSEIIRHRIKEANAEFNCNSNISKFIKSDHELKLLQDEVQNNMEQVLRSLVIDTENDYNTKETAKRVAKMFINETFSGRFLEKPRVTAFPNSGYDQIYTVGPISIRSTCAHHFQNITGNCYIAIHPGKEVIGLSKFNRLTEWIASRPSIQEEMTTQIADEIEKITSAKGLIVMVKATHACMTHRGVKEPCSDMTTSVVRGTLRDKKDMRREALLMIENMKDFRTK